MFKNYFVFGSLMALCTGCSAPEAGRPLPPPIELRGAVLSNDDGVLESKERIADALQFLADHNFNLVCPVVWEDGRAFFRSATIEKMPGAGQLLPAGNRDPLAEVLEEAHKRNIAVLPRIAGGFTAGPPDGELLRLNPRWSARDRMHKIVVKSGAAWLNAFHPEVQSFMSSLLLEIIKNYDIDGLQGSPRFPAQPIEAGYDSLFHAEYTELHSGNPPPLDVHEKHWKYWRAVRLTTFGKQVYRTAKALRPDAVVAWAVNPYPGAIDEYLQDWRWLITKNPDAEYYADIIHPEIELGEIETYRRTLNAQHRDSLRIFNDRRYLFPAIVPTGNVSGENLREAIRYNRLCGYNGEIFVSYAALRKDNDRLAKVLKESYYRTPASLPFAAGSMPK